MRFPIGFLTSKTARIGLVIAACLLGLSLNADGSASAAARSTSSVRNTLEKSLSAAKSAGSVRITVEFFSGSTTGKVVQDSSMDSGEQTVAIGKELASVVLVGGVAYISGNGSGMTSFFGLPASVVSKIAGRAISIPHSDPAFRAVTSNVTLASALVNVTPSRPLSMGKPSRVNGRSVKSIAGAAPGGGGRVTLFVAAHGRSLPVKAVESSRAGTSAKGEIVTFTRWGESLHVATPQGAIPISTLEAASSASG